MHLYTIYVIHTHPKSLITRPKAIFYHYQKQTKGISLFAVSFLPNFGCLLLLLSFQERHWLRIRQLMLIQQRTDFMPLHMHVSIPHQYLLIYGIQVGDSL